MTTASDTARAAVARYSSLAAGGYIDEAGLAAAYESAAARLVDIESVLSSECRVPKKAILNALSEYYGLPALEYDERIPIPPELLAGLDGEALSYSYWFPVFLLGDTVTIAVNDPDSPAVAAEFERRFSGYRRETMVALKEDIGWLIKDFLHARPGLLIGTDRTGYAYWRNTMAHWRTRLACYRTEMAKARTDLAVLRGGLGLTAVSETVIRSGKSANPYVFRWLLFAGFVLTVFGFVKYIGRRGAIKAPGHQTLVEVTAAAVSFLEDYHLIETGVENESKATMLGRLGDFIADHSTYVCPIPASKERTCLARERNVLAAQRTLAAAYRTIYARARTGLAFIRTGVSFVSVGLGLAVYYGLGIMTAVDSFLFLMGIFMVVDGVLWYMPVRKELAELPRCRLD